MLCSPHILVINVLENYTSILLIDARQYYNTSSAAAVHGAAALPYTQVVGRGVGREHKLST